MNPSPAPVRPQGTLKELAALFLRLGFTAFGGPAAHIAMMEEEVVRRRHWLTREEFLDLLGATNLIPGPNSTEMAIHIGQRRAGWKGLFLAGTCFIVPAASITLALAWAYARYGTIPQAAGFLYGIKAVIIAVVVQALYGLGKTALKTKPLAVIALLAVVANILGVNELAVLAGAGIAAVVAQEMTWRLGILAILPAWPSASMAAGSAISIPFGLGALFLFFLKVGSVLYGSGYVLLAFLRADLVERWHWLTPSQLLDAIAVGQFTPGPVFTTATFIGYLLGGVPGAGLATLGIFLPSFVFVALSGPLIPRLRRSPTAGAFLNGVNAASLALMFIVTVSLGRSAIIDIPAGILATVSACLLIRYRLNSVWLVLAGGAAGLCIGHA